VKLASINGRATVVVDNRLVDVEKASGGELSADPMKHLGSIAALESLDVPDGAPGIEGALFDAPVPRPSKVLGIGLNYRKHAEETGMSIPDEPVVFAKFPNAICGPNDDIVIPAATKQVDWEAELVAVIG
jgi:2,4-diketo-3-deoxy-L-fuconate hydrolase